MRTLLFALCCALLPLRLAAECATEQGRVVFQKCATCHSLDAHASGAEGPSLLTVFGRAAGTLEGFRFSPALRESGIVWNGDSLDRYLRDPAAVVPGNRMPFFGLGDDEERSAVICFLASFAEPASSPGSR